MAEPPDIEESFVQLVVSHQAALHAFVVGLLPGNPEADDVVRKRLEQEALFAKWVDGTYKGQLNTQVKLLLDDLLAKDAVAEGAEPSIPPRHHT